MNFKKMYEEESLAGSAVTVFASALLVLMSPQWSDGTLKLLPDVHIHHSR